MTSHIVQVLTWHELPPWPLVACTLVIKLLSANNSNFSNCDSATPSIEMVRSMGDASFVVRVAVPCCLAVAGPPHWESSTKSQRMNVGVPVQLPCVECETNDHADAVSPSGVQQP